MQNASATPRWPVRKNIKDTCRWRGLFYISLDLSTPIFSIWTLTLWKFFRNRLGLGQSTPIFFRPPTLKRICDVGRGLNVARSRTSLTHDRTYFVNAWSHVPRQRLIHFVNACFASLTHDRHVTHVFSFIDSTVFLWLNIDQAITVNSFVYETNIDFFYSRTFQHLFRRFDVTLHSPLKIRQARQKIEDFSDVTFTSSLKHYCRIEHFNKHFCVVFKLQHIFEHLLCTQEPSTPRVSDTGTPGWR